MDIKVHLFVLVLLSSSLRCESWGWFSSSKESHSNGNEGSFKGSSAEFSIEAFNNPKGMKLIENAKNKMVGSNSCWQNAYQNLFAGCSEILVANEKRSRFAWHLSDCFQKDSGRASFPHCDSKTSISSCLRNLDDLAHKVYLEFYLETNSLCYQLQNHAFKHETERLVTELKSSAQYVEDKLDSIEEKSDHLLQDSKQISDSLEIVNSHTQLVAQNVKNVEGYIDVVLRHSESVYDQTTKIATSQSQLKESQDDMKRTLEDGVALVKESYSHFGNEIEKLREEAIVIENEVIKVGDAMSSKMNTLQSKAEDIENKAGISLDKQQQLLDGQSTALEGLNSLNEVQSKALEESRKSLQYFAEFGHKQQEEFIRRQEEMKGNHDRLMENLNKLSSSQESFEAKQANMFIALDKLHTLQNTILFESRWVKAFVIYFVLISIIFLLTSTKLTYNARPPLYIGACASLFVEFIVIRLTNDNMERQTWIINNVRLTFLIAVLVKIVYAICTYKDLEKLNYQMLLTLVNINNKQKLEESSSWDIDDADDDEVDWSRWIDTDLPDDLDCLDDPNFIIPEDVAKNSIITSTTTKSYNLRSRNRLQ
ncbi:protein GAMETE EXPRESSED 1-like [Trifolium pratense]|uniref:protein GAMETE EXPRESSED 1-like n=1 Tax=Trifolium pratense TaxID=57577 RepID=UPI001E691DA1|nr:protein GAMETE EXPRESSED 1-like [Trifolium pratense]